MSNRATIGAVFVSSIFLNIFALAVPLYLLQSYNKAVPENNGDMLTSVTMIAFLAVLAFGALEFLRRTLILRFSVNFYTRVSKLLLGRSILRSASKFSISTGVLHDLASCREFLSSSSLFAWLDVPWTPIFVLALFLVHPWLGIVGAIACVLLFSLAWISARQTNTLQRTSFNVLKLVLVIAVFFFVYRLMLNGALTTGVTIVSVFFLWRAIYPLEQSIRSWKSVKKVRQAYRNISYHLDHSATLEQQTTHVVQAATRPTSRQSTDVSGPTVRQNVDTTSPAVRSPQKRTSDVINPDPLLEQAADVARPAAKQNSQAAKPAVNPKAHAAKAVARQSAAKQNSEEAKPAVKQKAEAAKPSGEQAAGVSKTTKTDNTQVVDQTSDLSSPISKQSASPSLGLTRPDARQAKKRAADYGRHATPATPNRASDTAKSAVPEVESRPETAGKATAPVVKPSPNVGNPADTHTPDTAESTGSQTEIPTLAKSAIRRAGRQAPGLDGPVVKQVYKQASAIPSLAGRQVATHSSSAEQAAGKTAISLPERQESAEGAIVSASSLETVRRSLEFEDSPKRSDIPGYRIDKDLRARMRGRLGLEQAFADDKHNANKK